MSYIDKIKVDGSLYSVQDDRLPSPDAKDEGKVITVDASGNYELNAPVDAYSKSETNELLADKQNVLTAGSNISIDNNIISATDTTYTAGTNIDITNNVISVTGQLGVDDYDDLYNKPIINQDLDAEFTPVEGTYYKHVGTTDTYTAGVIYLYDGEAFKAIDGSGSGGTSDYFELENAPFKEVPEAQISDITTGTEVRSLYIDTSKTVDWSYCTFNNAVMGEKEVGLSDVSYVTEEPQDPEESPFWKDGNTFKYYDSNNSSWVTFVPITVSQDKYIITQKSGKEGSHTESWYDDAYLDGSNVSMTTQSSEPDPSSYSENDVWYNSDANELYKNIDNSGTHEWVLLSSSDYEVVNGGEWIFFSNSEILDRASYMTYMAFAVGQDDENGAIMGIEYDMTTQLPSVGILKYIMINTESISGGSEMPVICNKTIEEYGFEEVVENLFSHLLMAKLMP